MTAGSILGTVRDLVPELAERATEIEGANRLPPDIAATIAHAGVFGMAAPPVGGGTPASVDSILEVIEACATASGSVGWCVMIGVTSAVSGAYLPDPVATEIFSDPMVIIGGVFAPTGRATSVENGYRLSGHWSWASGSQHCDWMALGAVVDDPDGGPPRTPMLYVPADEVEIVPNWDVIGLKGTGSHDLRVEDVFVPADRAVLLTDAPVRSEPTYRFPVFGLLALGISAVSLGVARSAITTLSALATTKVPTAHRRRLADRDTVTAAVAQAEARLRAARAFVFQAVAEATTEAEQGAISIERRTALRLAATHAAHTAAEVTNSMFLLGGGTAVRNDSELGRQLADARVATQHLMVAPATWELCGRLLLGIDADTSML